ncbi:2,3-diaminopropionate biosynthesis protein SbnA [Flexivirga meconopsidis]|uniref:2,3-diaminopropionate biosynthesis protein SbnA n=1 Tax=Flexivirga meconopsidis TaxID=2977121 RepID=UPI00223F1370|nr:2,3-diaminopropionate biosynthesis protein SbnA [Flexivirga meconopsidis]
MPVVSRPEDFHEDELFVDAEPIVGRPIHLKVEGANLAGSIKLKAAASMIDAAQAEGRLPAGTTLVESSSGNLGVALATIAAHRGLSFLCVTDDRCNPVTLRLMRALGAQVHVVTRPDPEQGYLGARLRVVRELAGRPGHLWLNQYANEANWGAHYRRTAPAVLRNFPHLDVLFVGAGTTGTLMGCARYVRETTGGRTRVVGVDSVGSVTFGTPAGPRHVPGLGAGVPPAMFDPDLVDDFVLVPEIRGIQVCRELAAGGYLFGGSTGTVLAGALDWLATHDPARKLSAVTIAPDLGERYLDSVYDDDWVRQHFGLDALNVPPPTAEEEPDAQLPRSA